MPKSQQRIKWLGAFLAIGLGFLFAATNEGSGHAQSLPSAPAPPVHTSVDSNGVDLISGGLNLWGGSMAIGQVGDGGLAYSYSGTAPSAAGTLLGTINTSGGVFFVSLGDSTEKFGASGMGSTLAYDTPTQTYIYTRRDGTVATYSAALIGNHPRQANQGNIVSLAMPNGEVLSYTYNSYEFCGGYNASGQCMYNAKYQRPRAITSNRGYQLRFNYVESDITQPNSLYIIKVIGINTAIDYCDPNADACNSFSQVWPSINVDMWTGTVTDAAGQVTVTSEMSLKRASGAQTTKTSTGSTSFTVSNAVGTWSYSWADSGANRTMNVVDPLGHSRTVVSDWGRGLVLSDTDALGHTTAYQYDSFDRTTRVTLPEGNYTQYTYDARGNVTEKREVSKTPGSPADIVELAGYDAACANPKTCNKPNWTRDALGHQTDYTYAPQHGGVLTVTLPAGANGVQPQLRYGYTQLPSYSKNSTASLVQTGAIWKLTSTSTCANLNLSACVGGADEIKTTAAYTGPNLLPTSTSSGSGDGALTATTATTYDTIGNALTVDGPLAGTGDTTRYRYDAVRRVIGVTGPSFTNASGQTKNRAVRTSYANGLPVQVEQGTVAGQSDGAWPSFVSLQQQVSSYDAIDRVIKSATKSGATTYSVTQYSYDAVNRLDCTAVRLNPANSSLPAACTVDATGDLITKNTYDNANRITGVTTGYGATSAHDEATSTYTDNGLVQTLADGNGNLTTYEYDGLDRLTKTRLPNASGGGSSTTDYVQQTYDAASNITQENRRGQIVNYTYDNLNQISYRNAPATSYAYDNLGREKTISANGQTLTNVYDALGRLTSQQGPQGQFIFGYNLDGSRARTQWNDGFYVDYGYNPAGDLTNISEAGGFALVSFSYDDLGQRKSLTRGNGVTTNYTYDPASRMTGLGLVFPNATNNQTLSFSYDAASRTVSRTSSNAAYAATPPGVTDRTYTINGLNQVTVSGGLTLTYDKGRLVTNGGGTNFSYSADDRLSGVSGGGAGASATYDPDGRLDKIVGSATTRFAYDGADMIAEYDAGGGLLRRYVHGPGQDEPLVWYESGLATPPATSRRWLAADQQGSIITTTDSAGAVIAVNTYDEYGIPGPSNIGRFQFTGQVWLPDFNVYHYKARAYSPTLGRFLQTDPIGYGDGMNWYAYVGNDPVNNIDPAGLDDQVNGVVVTGCGPTCIGERWEKAFNENYQRYLDSSFNTGILDFETRVGDWSKAAAEELFWGCLEGGCGDGGFVGGVGKGIGKGVVLAKEAALAAREAALAKRLGILCHCFEAGTLVATADGPRAIETLRVGDLVLSRSDASGETAFKPINALMPGEAREIWHVVVEPAQGGGKSRRETIHTTEEHPFRTTDGVWTPAARLKAGATIITADGRPARVVSAGRTGRQAPTYNFEVAEFHTYFVGHGQLWVHNSCLYDANKLLHIFGQAKHGMGPLVSKFGSERAAMSAIHSAAQSVSPSAFAAGTRVMVGGESVYVRGAVVNGVNRIGTASMVIKP